MPAHFSLQDKLIWVTGGAGYLGSAVTAALDDQGAKVVCIDLPGRAAAQIEHLRLNGTVPVGADLSDAKGLASVVQELIRDHGTPDGVAHLAVRPSDSDILETLKLEDFSRTVDLALTPTFALCRLVAEAMKGRGNGSVVLFSSMYGLVAPDKRIYHGLAPNPIDYGVSKAAILQLSRYFAMHYGRDGVRFNCVTPGPFPSPEVRTRYPEFLDELDRKTLLGRVGNAREIVGPTLFLMTDSASFITGQNLVVDGGWTAW